MFRCFRRSFTILSTINSPDDLKKLPKERLPELAGEIRRKIIEVLARNGGHLASNLGCVELTIAIHRVFDSPRDAVIFDVSHQCYTHKLLTGRFRDFPSVRLHGGISGFTKRCESCHDYFDNGHSSTSISQGLGLLTAWNLDEKSRGRKVVVVIGDGSLTGGMAFEALSHAGQISKNLIVVLNDNQMSISANTGALSRTLSMFTMTRSYQRFRYFIDGIVDRIPFSEHHLGKFIFRLKRAIKGFCLSVNFFTDLGFEYVGPLDGHDVDSMEEAFRRAAMLDKPVVVHVRTKKGKGYSPAENDPASFHGVGPFQITNGVVEKFDSLSFTESFSNDIVSFASRDSRIAAITAAMSKGTGLDAFSRKFPERFFDVGIAEEHAVTFASGLARGGMVPVVAIYSTFMQRAVDQVVHDIAIQGVHAVLVLDRAGVVPSDGETHQGLFDIALFRPVPNLVMMSPASAADLRACLEYAFGAEAPVMIRYPKSSCPSELPSFSTKIDAGNVGRGIFVPCDEFEPSLSVQFDCEQRPRQFRKVLLVTTGGMYCEVLQAARILLQAGIRADIYTLRFLKPFDVASFRDVLSGFDGVVFVEDGVRIGGIGEFLSSVASSSGVRSSVMAFPDRFLPQGTREQICADCGMSPKDIARAAGMIVGGSEWS